MLNAIFYLNKTGCQWEYLPNDFPPQKTVYTYYQYLCGTGRWERILQKLVVLSRQKSGKKLLPRMASLTHRALKRLETLIRGIDGGKKVKGRKRHIVVDTLGHLLHIKVHAANKSDTKKGCKVFEEALG